MRHLRYLTTLFRNSVGVSTSNDFKLSFTVLNYHAKHLCSVVNGNKHNSNDEDDTDFKEKDESESEETRKPALRLALKLLYMGQDYRGFQFQGHDVTTIEKHLFDALFKSRLTKENTRPSRYAKMSRTDIGVSAIHQIVAFDVQDDYRVDFKSNGKEQKTSGEDQEDQVSDDDSRMKEPDLYGTIKFINNVLPNDIKVLAWAFVPQDFNPRIKGRNLTKTYKYWFINKDMDLEIMSKACKKYEGTHNFMNFCAIKDSRNYFICTISSATVEVCDDPLMGVFTVTADRFMTYQIRYMVKVLQLIGRKKEVPEVIDELLNVQANPARPAYKAASGLHLCLCSAESDNEIKWEHDIRINVPLIRKMEIRHQNHKIMAELTKSALDNLIDTELNTGNGIMKWKDIPQRGRKAYTSIMNLKRCDETQAKSKKLKRKSIRRKKRQDPDYVFTDEEQELLLNKSNN